MRKSIPSLPRPNSPSLMTRTASPTSTVGRSSSPTTSLSGTSTFSRDSFTSTKRLSMSPSTARIPLNSPTSPKNRPSSPSLMTRSPSPMSAKTISSVEMRSMSPKRANIFSSPYKVSSDVARSPSPPPNKNPRQVVSRERIDQTYMKKVGIQEREVKFDTTNKLRELLRITQSPKASPEMKRKALEEIKAMDNKELGSTSKVVSEKEQRVAEELSETKKEFDHVASRVFNITKTPPRERPSKLHSPKSSPSPPPVSRSGSSSSIKTNDRPASPKTVPRGSPRVITTPVKTGVILPSPKRTLSSITDIEPPKEVQSEQTTEPIVTEQPRRARVVRPAHARPISPQIKNSPTKIRN